MMSLSANLKQKQLLCGFIPSKSFLQVSLCHIVYHYPRALPLLCPPGRGVVIILFTTDLTDWTDEPLELLELLSLSYWKQNKNQINPLEMMEGDALLSCFRLGLIRASS